MEYKCEFCDTIYPTSYMIRQHTNTAHDVTKLNKFMEKVEQFMEKTKRINELK